MRRRAWWPWPTTRRPGGGASIGAGSRRPGPTCWSRSCSARAARPTDLHLCTGAVALAAADACREVAGVEPVLKWPNDLLVGGSKLAGVLAEAEFAGRIPGGGGGRDRDQRGLAGAGGGRRDLPGRRWAPVRSRSTARILLDRLLGALRPRCGLLDDAAGRRVLADEVRRRCATLGQRVRVVLAGEEFTGRRGRHRRRGAPGRRDGVRAPPGDAPVTWCTCALP